MTRFATTTACALLLAAFTLMAPAPMAQAETLVLPAAGAPIPVPPFPFDDLPDTVTCSVPQPLGSGVSGTLHGELGGALVEPMVYLYDSLRRSRVMGMVAAGSEVEVVLKQLNPVIDFFLVRYRSHDGRSVEGWVPAPFLRLH